VGPPVVNISIVSGWLPLVVQGLAVVTFVASIQWRTGVWRRQLGRGLPLATGVAGLAAVVVTLGSPVADDVPWQAYLWGFLAVLAGVATAVGWSQAGLGRRGLAVVAVVLLMVMTVGVVNQRSDSFPTIGRLVDTDPEHVVGTPQLRQLKEQVAASGRLPARGVVITVTIPPTTSHFATRPAYVYLPPAWFAKVTPSLPTLVLLPGEPGSASDWSGDGDADNTADAFAAVHHGLAPITVMPDPDGFRTVDTECVNSSFGDAETYLFDDVPAFARSQFHASSAPGSLAIAGLSAGGTCSVMLALRHPSVYPTFASYSGFASPQYQETTRAETVDTLFGGSEDRFAAHDPVQILRTGHFDGMAGWFEVGAQDADPLDAARTLQPAALRAGIATCILVRPGGHDFDLWKRALMDSFPWLSWRLGLTPEPTSEPARCTSS
jgi:S-formylglutathione hydrolase FrmB